MGPALQLVFAFACGRKSCVFLGPDQAHRPARSGPVGAFALIVVLQALREVIGDADIEGAVGTLEDVAIEHGTNWCPSTSPCTIRCGASLGTPHPSPDVVEAGGVGTFRRVENT